MEISNDINLNNKVINEKEQNNFLTTTLGKTINAAVDIGIRTLLPDFLEEQIINLKDNLLNYGLKDGIQKTVSDTIELGKSAIGIFTGNFENISQMQNAVGTGGIIDGVSDVLDFAVDRVKSAGLINNTIANTIKQGKNSILNNVEKNIEKTFENQLDNIEQLNKYIDNWNLNYNKKDFLLMENDYKKIENKLKEIVPLENTINKTRIVENIHNLIKNNGQDFNLTKEQLELAEKLK